MGVQVGKTSTHGNNAGASCGIRLFIVCVMMTTAYLLFKFLLCYGSGKISLDVLARSSIYASYR
jgi:hypothetical protein